MSQTWTPEEIDAKIAAYLIANPPAGSGDFVIATNDTDDITEGATKKFATQAEKDKIAHLTVTQAVNLDTMESDIAGKMPIATGTPDGTKFLRDDGSWQAPSGGSGLTQPQVLARSLGS